jgi:UTP--glucose-1-phosphate uridylyltransferase
MIRKAIIPIAGKGTRLMPVTSVLPKALFPVVDRRNRITTILQILLGDVAQAGISDVCIVVSPGQQEIVTRYLEAASKEANVNSPERICFAEQSEPRGFGHAVLEAKAFSSDEPYLLLLGDHISIAPAGQYNCIAQVIRAFGEHKAKAMIGMHEVGKDVLSTVGVATGTVVCEHVLRCTDFVEKPCLEVAQERLRTVGVRDGYFLGHCGIYAFDAEFFLYLEQEERAVVNTGQEVELAAAQAKFLEANPDQYYLYRIEGKAYDMGNAHGYCQTFQAVRQRT